VHGADGQQGSFRLSVAEVITDNDCEAAIHIAVNGKSVVSSTTSATFDEGIRSCGGASNTAPGVWFEVEGSGTNVTASVCSPFTDYDTQLSVFDGSCSDNALECVGGNDDSPQCGINGVLSEVTWFAEVGEVYFILVHGYDSSIGAFELTVSEVVFPVQAKASGCSGIQCSFQGYDTTSNLAFSGNGAALPAVAKDTISGYPDIHNETFVNDGFYGNGASWISASVNSWVKIDLGGCYLIDTVMFGRDRVRFYNDRQPGEVTIFVASSDNIYATGDDSNDTSEYAAVFSSMNIALTLGETVSARFTETAGRYVKFQVGNLGAAIDELEIYGVPSTSCPS
jgi:hypothetical protein